MDDLRFGDSKKSSPADARDPRDEPFGIASNESLLRPAPPRGTAFNRRTVVALFSISGIIFTLGILYAFSPSQQKDHDAMEAMGSLEQEGAGKNSQGYVNTPEAINNIPDSYMNKKELSPNALTPGIPLDMTNVPSIPIELGAEKYIPHQFELPKFQERTEENQELKELNEARKSSIRFSASQKNSQTQPVSSENAMGLSETENALLNGIEDVMKPSVVSEEKADSQSDKREFMEKPKDLSFYARSSLKRPVSKFEVKASTVIPAVLITGINSDLPGYMSAQVRENVFDSVSGRYLLVPQGTRLIGLYDSKVNFGQKRVLVVWTRLIFPNGKSVDLENMPGVDLYGKSGLKDRVNNHWGRLIAGATITSLFNAAVNIAADNETDELQTDKELGAQGFGDGMMDFGSKLSNKNLEIQPSLEIRPGFKFNLFIHKDFVLEPYRN